MRRRRFWFNCSWLVIVAPAYFLSQQFYPNLEPKLQEERQDRPRPELSVGPWLVTIEEEDVSPASDEKVFMDYQLKIQQGPSNTLKSIIISADEPSSNDLGSTCDGVARHFSCRIGIAPPLPQVWWIIIEEWNGEIHKVKLPYSGRWR